MICEGLEYDWKSGIPSNEEIDGFTIPINYFTCGEYYFDGINYVVKFPKGMKIYYGSGILVKNNQEFPVGTKYYEPNNYNEERKISIDKLLDNASKYPDDSIDYLASLDIPEIINTSWYTDYNTAIKDSQKNKQCGDKCIECYILKFDAVFVLLDNDYNLWKLYGSSNITEDARISLKSMFDNNKFEPNDKTKYPNIGIKNKIQTFTDTNTIPFSKWFCQVYNTNNEYAGIAINTNKTTKGVLTKTKINDLKLMFCNALLWLRRDLNNNLDWQYRIKSDNKIIDTFLDQMSLYKTVNIESQAGDLLEHSIWTLLFAENYIANSLIELNYRPKLEKQELIAAIALIHDVGEMGEYKIIKSDGSYLYPIRQRTTDLAYTLIPNEGIRRGIRFVKGEDLIPVYTGEPLQLTSTIDFRDVMRSLKILDDEFNIVSSTIYYHKLLNEFIPSAIESNSDSTIINSLAEMYLDNMKDIIDTDILYCILVISVCSELATRPYGVNNLTVVMNKKSKYFPYISNMPMKHAGNNYVDVSADARNKLVKAIFKIGTQTLKQRLINYKKSQIRVPSPIEMENVEPIQEETLRERISTELKSRTSNIGSATRAAASAISSAASSSRVKLSQKFTELSSKAKALTKKLTPEKRIPTEIIQPLTVELTSQEGIESSPITSRIETPISSVNPIVQPSLEEETIPKVPISQPSQQIISTSPVSKPLKYKAPQPPKSLELQETIKKPFQPTTPMSPPLPSPVSKPLKYKAPQPPKLQDVELQETIKKPFQPNTPMSPPLPSPVSKPLKYKAPQPPESLELQPIKPPSPPLSPPPIRLPSPPLVNIRPVKPSKEQQRPKSLEIELQPIKSPSRYNRPHYRL